MRVRCLHGYFIFDEMRQGQISDFMQYSDLILAPKDNYYTFEELVDVPEYSLIGKNLLNLPATALFEGKPWEVFEANEFVFDFTIGLLVPITSIARIIEIKQAGNMFVTNGLIQPGSLTADGKRVKDYAAWFSRDRLTWHYSEVAYV